MLHTFFNFSSDEQLLYLIYYSKNAPVFPVNYCKTQYNRQLCCRFGLIKNIRRRNGTPDVRNACGITEGCLLRPGS